MKALSSEINQRYPLSLLLFNIVLKVLVRTIRHKKYVKGILSGKEEAQLSLFTDDMTLSIENPRVHQKMLELINEFSKVAGYKIHIQNSVAFLHTNNNQSKKEIKKTIPFKIASKWIKYLGINLTQEVKDMYTNKYKTLNKKSKEKKINGKTFWAHGLEEPNIDKILSPRANYRFNAIPMIPNDIFCRNGKIHSKIPVKSQRT